RRVAIARKKKKSTCQSIIDYAQWSLGNIWWVYISYAQETFSFPFFRDLELSIIQDLELSIILIGMVKYSN
ncbi:hypothetical protein C0J52_15910, partial [Blattella germanica]